MAFNPNEPRDRDGKWSGGGGAERSAAKNKAASAHAARRAGGGVVKKGGTGVPRSAIVKMHHAVPLPTQKNRDALAATLAKGTGGRGSGIHSEAQLMRERGQYVHNGALRSIPLRHSLKKHP